MSADGEMLAQKGRLDGEEGEGPPPFVPGPPACRLRVGMLLICVTEGQRAQCPRSHVDGLVRGKAVFLSEAVPLFLELCI